MASHKKKALTLETKLQILKDVDQKNLKQNEIAQKYAISKSTVFVLIKNRQTIEEACSSSQYQPNRKRMRTGKDEKVEEALFSWFKQTRAMQVPVSGTLMSTAATEIADEMGVEFSATTGWFDRFKKRRGIAFRAICGESAAVNITETDDWRKTVLPEILKDYHPNDIYNADETGIFFKCLPDKTLALKGEVCSGGKKAKDRLTALVATNMSGTDKLPLLVIGKVSKPRCFKNVRTLPVEYTFNKKAWMTSSIFESWIRKLDRRFHVQARQVVMFVDNCPAHPEIDNLRAIKLVFLPPNTTSVLQPCDQGIIQALKKLYRKRVLQKYLIHMKNAENPQAMTNSFDVNVLEAMYMLRCAWEDVTETVIANCFRHAGFTVPQDLEKQEEAGEGHNTLLELEAQKTVDGADNDMRSLFDSLKDLMPTEDITLDDFCNIDNNVVVCEEVSIKEIVTQVNGSPDSDSDGETEEYAGVWDDVVTASQAREAVQVLKRFSLQQEDGDELIDLASKYENCLNKTILKGSNSKQMKINDFFVSR